MSISKILKERRKALGYTLLDIAKMMDVSEATVQRWESGNIKSLRYERVGKLSEILKVSPADLMGWTEEHPKEKAVRIPVYAAIPAGIPLEAVDDIVDWEEISPDMAKQGEFFALRVKGDSMEPRIRDGDVVIVRCQSAVDNGDVAVVMVNASDATLKRFHATPAGVKLLPDNPSHNPMFFTPEEVEQLPVRVLGRVVELRAKF